MKKLLLLITVLSVSVVPINAQSRWNAGIETGCLTNISRFDSGDETANALFTNNLHHAGRLAVNFRYKISEKFSFQTGIDFAEFGFDYGLAKDYSLKKPFERDEVLSAATCITSIPVMAVMNTPLNCTNKRFIFGLGAVVRGIDNNWNTSDFETITYDESGTQKAAYMAATTRTTSSVSGAVTWMIGLERVLKNGNSLTFTYRGTQGIGTIAKSDVSYTVDNKTYEHGFINRGSFVSFSLGYNFLPFGSRKVIKQQKQATPQM